MKIIFAPDSFKGTISASRICELLETAAKTCFPDCQTISIPMSDGGEGALETIIPSVNGQFIIRKVSDPLKRSIKAKYGTFGNNSALIEMATASGLPLVPADQRDIRKSNTYGTGELIRDALDQGCRSIHIAIGGSATNDGGIGCAAALGVKFYNENGVLLEPIPENLIHIAEIDTSAVHPALHKTKFTVMCDVKNPLLGSQGATYIFGPQKGASEEDILFLEKGMAHYADVIQKKFSISLHDMPGAGAAGGLGGGLMVFTKAKLKPGIDTILDIVDFHKTMADSDLIITGEGRMDHQSAYGKVASGVGLAAKAQHIPCIAIVGSMDQDACNMYDYGITSIMTCVASPMPVDEVLERAEELFANAADRMMRLIKAGMTIGS